MTYLHCTIFFLNKLHFGSHLLFWGCLLSSCGKCCHAIASSTPGYMPLYLVLVVPGPLDLDLVCSTGYSKSMCGGNLKQLKFIMLSNSRLHLLNLVFDLGWDCTIITAEKMGITLLVFY